MFHGDTEDVCPFSLYSCLNLLEAGTSLPSVNLISLCCLPTGRESGCAGQQWGYSAHLGHAVRTHKDCGTDRPAHGPCAQAPLQGPR